MWDVLNMVMIFEFFRNDVQSARPVFSSQKRACCTWCLAAFFDLQKLKLSKCLSLSHTTWPEQGIMMMMMKKENLSFSTFFCLLFVLNGSTNLREALGFGPRVHCTMMGHQGNELILISLVGLSLLPLNISKTFWGSIKSMLIGLFILLHKFKASLMLTFENEEINIYIWRPPRAVSYYISKDLLSTAVSFSTGRWHKFLDPVHSQN